MTVLTCPSGPPAVLTWGADALLSGARDTGHVPLVEHELLHGALRADAARTLAARLDDPDDAKNARLWKEYREFVDQLIKIGEERSSEFDDVLRGLEASLRDTPAR